MVQLWQLDYGRKLGTPFRFWLGQSWPGIGRARGYPRQSLSELHGRPHQAIPDCAKQGREERVFPARPRFLCQQLLKGGKNNGYAGRFYLGMALRKVKQGCCLDCNEA